MGYTYLMYYKFINLLILLFFYVLTYQIIFYYKLKFMFKKFIICIYKIIYIYIYIYIYIFKIHN